MDGLTDRPIKHATENLVSIIFLKDYVLSGSVRNSQYCSLRDKLLSNHLQHKQRLVENLGSLNEGGFVFECDLNECRTRLTKFGFTFQCRIVTFNEICNLRHYFLIIIVR